MPCTLTEAKDVPSREACLFVQRHLVVIDTPPESEGPLSAVERIRRSRATAFMAAEDDGEQAADGDSADAAVEEGAPGSKWYIRNLERHGPSKGLLQKILGCLPVTVTSVVWCTPLQVSDAGLLHGYLELAAAANGLAPKLLLTMPPMGKAGG